MASKAPPLLAAALVLLALLAPLPQAAAWDDRREGDRAAYQRPAPALGNDTYVYAGTWVEGVESPTGPLLNLRHCWRVTGDGRLDVDSEECGWSGEAAGPERGGVGDSQVAGRIVVGATVMGESRCVAEVDGTEVHYPCCTRETASPLPCVDPRARPPGLLP